MLDSPACSFNPFTISVVRAIPRSGRSGLTVWSPACILYPRQPDKTVVEIKKWVLYENSKHSPDSSHRHRISCSGSSHGQPSPLSGNCQHRIPRWSLRRFFCAAHHCGCGLDSGASLDRPRRQCRYPCGRCRCPRCHRSSHRFAGSTGRTCVARGGSLCHRSACRLRHRGSPPRQPNFS